MTREYEILVTVRVRVTVENVAALPSAVDRAVDGLADELRVAAPRVLRQADQEVLSTDVVAKRTTP